LRKEGVLSESTRGIVWCARVYRVRVRAHAWVTCREGRRVRYDGENRGNMCKKAHVSKGQEPSWLANLAKLWASCGLWARCCGPPFRTRRFTYIVYSYCSSLSGASRRFNPKPSTVKRLEDCGGGWKRLEEDVWRVGRLSERGE
jgi:hypothetical protein